VSSIAEQPTINVPTPYDLFLFGEGRHQRAWEFLGAHYGSLDDQIGVNFATWAPSATSVAVIGDFNGWDGDNAALSAQGSSGVWSGFVPGCTVGQRYKFRILTASGEVVDKADPYARETEIAPRTASVIAEEAIDADRRSQWDRGRQAWLGEEPVTIYEVHLGSFNPEWATETYESAASVLVQRVVDLGFTHVEFLPLTEHPYGGSWGYQATSYFAPTSRWGSPAALKTLIDALHAAGIGAILDWVPGHFATDAFGLFRFDGTALYEHLDPRQGIHPDWGSAIFNLSRNEVRSFLLSSARYWIEVMGFDALRVDAVASMLYLDYSRDEWIPNAYGGRENLDAQRFLRELNEMVPTLTRGATTMAEESTAFPKVTQPTYLGGLGFGFKWNMGWMHDTLDYFHREPIHRQWHQHQLTFGLLYAFTENFILPISHDEVVHGKGSLYTKMPGDHWQKLANVRALLAWMWTHPGKKLLFMGCEFAQGSEWSEGDSTLRQRASTAHGDGIERVVRDLNRLYRSTPALYSSDYSGDGFAWTSSSDAASNVLGFCRFASEEHRRQGASTISVIANFSPVPRENYTVGLPHVGLWQEIFNGDASVYGGSGIGNLGSIEAHERPAGGYPYSGSVVLPPLSVVILEHRLGDPWSSCDGD
jgi:1,4-alpha-glucan branching enzyme